ncbi:MAG: HAD family phosphatase [Bacteroidetes bacterium]|nr:MAG: HAD family phosphatase [Bacteroidota bacterium]
MEIRNIIFDFGGVIINIHHSEVEKAFKNLGINQFETLFSQATQSDIFQRLEIGTISPGNFRNYLRSIIGKEIPDHKLDFAWNQIIGNYPPHRIKLLSELKKNYNLFLLSNTNIIHYRYYIEKFRNEFGFEFQSLFNKTYWSFEISERKPNHSAFTFVLKDNNLIASETLFIDDSVQNIDAAEQMGFQTYLLKNDTDLADIFGEGKIIL